MLREVYRAWISKAAQQAHTAQGLHEGIVQAAKSTSSVCTELDGHTLTPCESDASISSSSSSGTRNARVGSFSVNALYLKHHSLYVTRHTYAYQHAIVLLE